MSKKEVTSSYALSLLARFMPVKLINRMALKLSRKVVCVNASAQGYNYKQQPVTPPASPWLLILSRNAYSESWSNYPVASLAELKKILKQQNAGELRYHFYGAYENGARKVLTISPKAELHTLCLNAKVVMPISLLLAVTIPPQLVDVTFAQERFFCMISDCFRWQSLPESGLINTLNAAAPILGAGPELKSSIITALNLPSLKSLFLSMPLRHWFSMFNTKSVKPGNMLPVFIAASLMVLSFFVISTLYLAAVIDSRQQKVAQLNPAVQQSLGYREQVDDVVRLVAAVNKHLPSSQAELALWNIIALAEQQGVYFTSVQSDLIDITLQGESVSATAFLHTILQLPYVENAGFIAPVRRIQSGREQFLLSVSLVPETVVITDQSEVNKPEALFDTPLSEGSKT